MQRNFILTDVMKTGNHQELESYISMHSMAGQSFDMTGEYYTLHEYDLDSYDRRFAMIDTRSDNDRLKDNAEFMTELHRRVDLLKSQGFVFIKANPWESLQNINEHPEYMWPKIDVDHIKWTGGTTWFWHHMYNRHNGKTFNFDHSYKKYDFLYLNKTQRDHREKLYTELSNKGILENSLYTNWPDRKLPADYELPWAQDYPQYGMDQDIYEKPYNDTACSIVSETNDNNNEIFMTEKIWKPILAQHVFVVHGNHLYLQKLREMGFRTFNNYFEEAYDLDRDPNMRINTIVDVCDRLRDAPWQDIYSLTKALRKHNHDTMFNKEKLSLEINKHLDLFLEFADTSQVSS
tara:strand:+ start:2708 stop:3751 length:1044 start_codon:yes stop_codon:yes gene_type:complete